MYDPSSITSRERKAGLTLIDVACVFAVFSVVGWQIVPYFLLGSAGLFVVVCAIAVAVAAVIGSVRLVWLLFARQKM